MVEADEDAYEAMQQVPDGAASAYEDGDDYVKVLHLWLVESVLMAFGAKVDEAAQPVLHHEQQQQQQVRPRANVPTCSASCCLIRSPPPIAGACAP